MVNGIFYGMALARARAREVRRDVCMYANDVLLLNAINICKLCVHFKLLYKKVFKNSKVFAGLLFDEVSNLNNYNCLKDNLNKGGAE